MEGAAEVGDESRIIPSRELGSRVPFGKEFREGPVTLFHVENLALGRSFGVDIVES